MGQMKFEIKKISQNKPNKSGFLKKYSHKKDKVPIFTAKEVILS